MASEAEDVERVAALSRRGCGEPEAVSMPEGLETCVLYLEVKDSGMGVTEDVCSKLFQVFMEGDNSTSRRFGGTGMGLAISKNLVSLMGGHIGWSSRVG